jgi:hypothetical protein
MLVDIGVRRGVSKGVGRRLKAAGPTGGPPQKQPYMAIKGVACQLGVEGSDMVGLVKL